MIESGLLSSSATTTTRTRSELLYDECACDLVKTTTFTTRLFVCVFGELERRVRSKGLSSQCSVSPLASKTKQTLLLVRKKLWLRTGTPTDMLPVTRKRKVRSKFR